MIVRRVAVMAVSGLAMSVTPVFAQVYEAPKQFEVASVRRDVSEKKPWLAPPVGGRFTATNVPLKLLIRNGWPQKLVGGPAWVSVDGYDVSAIMPKGDEGSETFQLMMRSLLEERFALKVHVETREAPVYILVPSKGGLKLPEAVAEPCVFGKRSEEGVGCGGMNVTPESITNQKIAMEWFVSVLGGVLGRPVIKETGFTGSFKVHLEFAPMAPDSESTKPTIADALEKQLGLRLETRKGTEEVLVIDHVERPSEN